MGVSHMASGFATGLWSSLAVAPLGVPAQVVWTFTSAAFSLAPDIDHPGSNAARMWGPLSRVPAGVVGRVFGHRGATHQIVGASIGTAVLVAVAWMAPYGQAFTVAFAVGMLLSAGANVQGGANILVSAACGYGATTLDWDAWWLPIPAAIGVATHIVGDSLTTSGAPGRDGRRWGLRAFTTGSPAEAAVCVLIAASIAAFPLREQLAERLIGAW
ncbi:metal-dependent hydrolase [Piscicoccus intestinalis]|uniref:metal-dependent hydrolase n=1 Tax=Piscicoccus intestinalis TaxID=746033 RepID=UPI00146FED37|nr:metal-dependent hydrolase [Piscicoccus intestinalis]